MYRSRTSRSVVVVALLALLLASCGKTVKSGSTSTATPTITLTEFKIAVSGSVPVSKAVSIPVVNKGAAPHQIVLETGAQNATTEMLQAGQSGTLKVPPLAAGSYMMYCTIPGHRQAGMETMLTVGGAATAAPAGAMTAAEMEQGEKAAVEAFPAKTEGSGGHIQKPVIKNGVKVFDLDARAVRWETAPNLFFDAYAYNGQIPGPELHVRQGDRVRVVVHNHLPEATVLHLHGLTLPNAMDGVGFLTQKPIEPGQSFTYAFTVVDPPGTYMYHSHFDALAQVGKGLLGAFIIDPKQKAWDVEQTMILGDGPLGYTINGKSFPATSPIVAPYGSKVLVRFLNMGQLLHPMHLHGFHFSVLNEDGGPVPRPYKVDTLVIAPGQRFDVMFTATSKGAWAFHCHILSHAEGDHGMFGMVTAVIVQ
jgi:FtsP/CotA-like multicopper oxidase with cupredoxin domain